MHLVDLKKRVANLPDTKNGGDRSVPLSKIATNVLAQALDNPVRPTDCDLVFFGNPGKDGKRHPYVFSNAWNAMKKKLGIMDFHFHDLRHEAVSRFVETGEFSDQQVAAVSGHKSMQMLKRYTHLRSEELIELLDRADSKKNGAKSLAQANATNFIPPCPHAPNNTMGRKRPILRDYLKPTTPPEQKSGLRVGPRRAKATLLGEGGSN